VSVLCATLLPAVLAAAQDPVPAQPRFARILWVPGERLGEAGLLARIAALGFDAVQLPRGVDP
jgi:hypothetical protein